MSAPKSRVHHYVPRWYQKRFLSAGQETLFYLNLKPEAVAKGDQPEVGSTMGLSPGESDAIEITRLFRCPNAS